jgi:hypothetical protein
MGQTEMKYIFDNGKIFLYDRKICPPEGSKDTE